MFQSLTQETSYDSYYGRPKAQGYGNAETLWLRYSKYGKTGVRVPFFLSEKCTLTPVLRMNTDRSATINLGTGRGVSVLELVRAFAAASGREIPYDIVERRAGDVAEVYADPGLAHALSAGARSSMSMPCAAMRGVGSR